MPLIGLSFMFAIQPQDFWWLLRGGQYMVEEHSFLTVDIMSLSRLGEATVFQPWLSGVILWFFYKTGGISFVLILRGSILLLTYGFLWGMIRERSNAYLATLLTLILGAATLNNWAIRAQLFTYPLFVLSMYLILDWQQGRRRRIFFLPLIVLLWANLHGSYILPIILAGAALLTVREGRGTLLIVLLLMGAATFITPLGLGLWRYFLFMLETPAVKGFVTEWAPPVNVGWQMNLFFGWLLVFTPLSAFFNHKLSKLEWLWFLAFGWLALSGIRFLIWFLFLLAYFSALLLAEPFQKIRYPEIKYPLVNGLLGVSILGLSSVFLPGIREKIVPYSIPVYEMETTPLAATRWLDQHPALNGPLWADYAFGAYLDFSLPSLPAWMDSRFHDFSAQQWTEYVQVSNAENWQAMFDRENINLLMLSHAAQPKLVEAVTSSQIWCEEYRDEYAVIFSRCEAE